MRDLIRDALERQPPGDCPDATRLAAYADRTLDRAERESVAGHLADCRRCRETLILMDRAAEAEKSAVRSDLSRSKGYTPDLLRRWPWLAGAAAATLAVVIWTTVRPSDEPGLLSQPPRPSAAEQRAREGAPPPDRPPHDMAAPPPASQAPAVANRSERRDSEVRSKPDSALADRMRKQSGPPAPGKAAATPAAPPAPAAETPLMAEAAAPPKRERLGQATGDTAQLRRAGEAAASAHRSGSMLTAAAPDGRTMWRIVQSSAMARSISEKRFGAVERSVDAGGTWMLEPAVEAPGARAIGAPSADVCWIVGQAGLILRYESPVWTRIQPPAAVDFVAVSTVDARRATIMAADGRRFSTADGGASWTPVP